MLHLLPSTPEDCQFFWHETDCSVNGNRFVRIKQPISKLRIKIVEPSLLITPVVHEAKLFLGSIGQNYRFSCEYSLIESSQKPPFLQIIRCSLTNTISIIL